MENLYFLDSIVQHVLGAYFSLMNVLKLKVCKFYTFRTFKVENLDDVHSLIAMWVKHLLGAISALLNVYYGNLGI